MAANRDESSPRAPFTIKTAILVDGGYYRKRAAHYWGKKDPATRAEELVRYCRCHTGKDKYLYRVFYYDCPPLDKNVFHPLRGTQIDFKKEPTYKWSIDFLNELKKKRKFALRLGKLEERGGAFRIKPDSLKKLLAKAITIDELTERDFEIDFGQKGVDMRIGLDIASLAHKKQVDQIILIAGDSDFVPAAKHARREGIDFILDPMGQKVNDDLFEHIDGMQSYWKVMPSNHVPENEPSVTLQIGTCDKYGKRLPGRDTPVHKPDTDTPT